MNIYKKASLVIIGTTFLATTAQTVMNIDKNTAIIRAPFQLVFIAIAYWHSR